jgi:hypothetical protein
MADFVARPSGSGDQAETDDADHDEDNRERIH